MSNLKMASTIFLFSILLLASCKKDPIAIGNVDCSTVSYSSTIAPLLTSSCNTSGCHDAGSNKGDLTTYEKVSVYVNKGTFKKEVLTDQSMPTSGPLTSEQLGQVQCWLDSGAPNN